MPATAPPGFRLGAIKPEDAIGVFLQRGLLRPSFRWQDVWQDEHARAFAVAGVMRLDVLKLIRDQVEEAVNNGTELRDFRDTLKEQLVAKGWWGDIEITDPATGEVRTTRFNEGRLKLIYDVNLRQSHAAGRWQRIQRRRLPYIVYRTMRDEKVRASHRPWDNVVLPKDHPWWDTHYPPNGWRCRCTAFAIDEKGLEALRKAAPKDAPVKTEPPETQWVEYLNKSSGRTERVPRGIDPGFAGNPGKVHMTQGVERLDRGLQELGPTRPGAGDAHRMLSAVVARQRRDKGFAQFLASPPAADVGLPVAAVPALAGEPSIASVAARELLAQQASGAYPPPLPVVVAQWALAQAIIDNGQRLQLADDQVLWWWVRGAGAEQSVLVLHLQRSATVWWTQLLAKLARDEAIERFPKLGGLL